MSEILTLPRLGETMETGRIVAWLKKPGEEFRRGEVIAEVETDKTTVELPAIADGRLIEILAEEGADIDVGQPIGRWEREGAAASVAASSAAAEPSPAEAPPPIAGVGEAVVAPPPPSPAPTRRGEARLRATPPARRLARRAGLDLERITGHGRRGRIERQDVEAALAAPSATASDLRFVELAGGRIGYREWGPADSAATLVLVHGFGGDGAVWASLAPPLVRRGFRVIAPDLPAHGATTVPCGGFDDLTAALGGLVAALGLGGAGFVGHSLGGAVVTRAAADRVIDASRLVLIAPIGLDVAIDADFVDGLARVGSGGGLAHLLRRTARRPPPLSKEELDRMAASLGGGRLETLAADLVADGRQQIDIVADLAGLDLPVRVIFGLDDRIVPWTSVANLPAKVAIHLIAGAGHMPHWDQARVVEELIATD